MHSATKILWATDVHLDHCSEETLVAFWQAMVQEHPAAICLTGDIAAGDSLWPWLERFQNEVQVPLYFILGNHDYYNSSIAEVRQQMCWLNQSHTGLTWLGSAPVIELNPTWGIVGCDGWGDGRLGNFLGSSVKLKDYRLIAELAATESPEELWALLQALGDAEAAYLAEQLPQALERYDNVLILTHPPPFAEACFYLGHVSADENWLPHFTCKAVGDVLKAASECYPHRRMLVLAGHSHNPCDVSLNPALRVCVGEAHYGAPRYETLWL